jgi:AcrR family transcriptional regulator
MTSTMPRSLRADAEDNRDRVLEAAGELFAAGGLAVPMRVVAARAGVAAATLYRRFPTKQALVQEVFAHQLRDCRAIVERAAVDADPWRALCTVVEQVLVLNARNQGFIDAFFAAHPDAFDLAEHRAEMLAGIAAIARRAIAAGRLRPDFVLDDFTLVLLAGRGLATAPTGERVAAARRFAAIAIDGLRRADSNGRLPERVRITRTAVGLP